MLWTLQHQNYTAVAATQPCGLRAYKKYIYKYAENNQMCFQGNCLPGRKVLEGVPHRIIFV